MRRRTNRQKFRQPLHHSQNHTQQVIVHAFSPGSTRFSLCSWVSLRFNCPTHSQRAVTNLQRQRRDTFFSDSKKPLPNRSPILLARFSYSRGTAIPGCALGLSSLRPQRTLRYLFLLLTPPRNSPPFSFFYFPFSNFFLISYASIFPK